MIFNLIYKAIRWVNLRSHYIWSNLYCAVLFNGNRVKKGKGFVSIGIPYIMIARGGECVIGENFIMINNIMGNPIGCYEKCTIVVDSKGKLKIGNNVGISQTAIICHEQIMIGNYVKIGGGVCIYDTDFHSLKNEHRAIPSKDIESKINRPILINDHVFIGAKSMILKGVTIGENSIIGAASVVTKSVPPNEIWAGNPARFIKKIDV